MRRVIVSPQADADLNEQFDYIAERNPDAARRFYIAARDTFDQLAERPAVGVARKTSNPALAGLRMRLVRGFSNFLVFYLTSNEEVNVIRVLHGARDIARVLNQTRIDPND